VTGHAKRIVNIKNASPGLTLLIKDLPDATRPLVPLQKDYQVTKFRDLGSVLEVQMTGPVGPGINETKNPASASITVGRRKRRPEFKTWMT
jgi:hypothetical protein